MQAAKSLLTFLLSPDNVKRLGPEDTKDVEKLTLKNTAYLFGNTSVEIQLDRNFLSVGIFNESEELAGVLCLNTHPNIPALPPWEWDYWVHNLYDIDDLTPITTLWIHYAVWDRRYTSLYLKPLLQNVFLNHEPLESVVMVCPQGISRLDFMEDHATRVLPKGYTNPVKVQTLYIAKKVDFVANYVIRRAVAEDNDDLVAIIPQVLEDTYGHYYISELLSNEDSRRQIIVAEHRGCAVGVLCLNESVNYDLLNSEFELVPYNGLKKYNAADEVGQPSQAASATMLPMETEYSNDRLSTILVAPEAKEEEENVEEDNVSDDEFSLVNLSSSLILNLMYEEEVINEVDKDSGSSTSIESHFSAVVLNEEYEDHLYNADRGDMSEVPEERKLRRKESRQEGANIPMYFGEANAFVMEICTSLPNHENCLYLLFQAAFECFPDRDYLIMSFPTDSKVCYVHKHLARVVPRGNSVFSHELCVLHRNSILGRMWLRPSHPQDKRAVAEIMNTLVKPAAIEEAFREAVDAPSSLTKAYTFLCEKQVIGFTLVTEESEHEYISLYYNVDPWLECKGSRFGISGCIEHFLLSPIFQRHTQFFLRELHRCSDFQVLFYRLKSTDVYTHRSVPMVNAITTMVPILPNPVPEYSKQIKEEFHLPDCLTNHHQPFGLYLSTARIMSMARMEIHQKIVVVGAGTTTTSFLENLIFGRNPNHLVIFASITVVSPHGILYHKQPNQIREAVFVSDGHLDRRYIDSICLKTYVHVVQGVMTCINRKEKYIGLNDDTLLPYDYLFLMCGKQFQKPPSKKKEVVKRRVDFPQNVFIINTEADAANAFNALKNLVGNKQGNTVVFGHYLEACCCLAALLDFGVPGSNLVYVDPCPDHASRSDYHDHLTQFFNNAAVETAVLDEILLQGVTLYQDYDFVEWHLDSTKKFISSAKFESKYKFVDIELLALFIYHSKGVSARTFQAIARSGLVFNGRLVIDKNCQTNDPCIYGAGPLTMYSKKYHAEHLMHRYYNAQEVGANLGREFRKKLIPEEYWDPPVKPPRFRRPVVRHCRFPGNLHYLQVSKPGQLVPLDVAMIKCNYGKVITTGDCKKLDQQGYFRLHLNQFQTVETITCLAKFDLPVRNLINLWGKHQVLLNHLSLRCDLNMIPDLFEYFDQAWAAALYHRHFPKLLDEIFDMLSTAHTPEGENLIDEVRGMLEQNEWSPLTKLQFDEIEEICRDTKIIHLIEQRLMGFLHDYYTYLPMYAHQLFIRWIIHQTQTSPLFVQTKLTYPEYSKSGQGQSGQGYRIPSLQRYKYSNRTSEYSDKAT